MRSISALAFGLSAMLLLTAPARPAPVGFGAGATGGGSGPVVSAGSMEEIQAAIDRYAGRGGLVIRYTGRFDFATIKDVCAQSKKPPREVVIDDKADITILGETGSSGNFGIRLMGKAQNIVIRNMKLGLLPGGARNGDVIGIEGEARDVWIDHNEFFSSMKACPGTGDTMFDGLIDIKGRTDRITISFNHLHDHHKVMLGGSSDSDVYDRRVTIHHNWFQNVGSRTPMNRHGSYHLFNNYYSNVAVSGINVRMRGRALIESNHFETVRNPVTARDSTVPGTWDLRNNLVGAGVTWSGAGGSTVNATAWTTTRPFGPVPYPYTPDLPTCVKTIVTAMAGVGRLNVRKPGCGGTPPTPPPPPSPPVTGGPGTPPDTAKAPVLAGTGDYPSGFTKCAALGKPCAVPKDATGWVAFGRKGKWAVKQVKPGSALLCTTGVFGTDPLGSPNKCSFQK